MIQNYICLSFNCAKKIAFCKKKEKSTNLHFWCNIIENVKFVFFLQIANNVQCRRRATLWHAIINNEVRIVFKA